MPKNKDRGAGYAPGTDDVHRVGRDDIPGSPVEAGTLADAEGLDGLQYVTGDLPYQSQEEMLLDMERNENRSADDRDQEAPEEVVANRVAFDEREDINTFDDVDRQGRRGQEEHDWSGDMYADSGRDRLNDGSRRKR